MSDTDDLSSNLTDTTSPEKKYLLRLKAIEQLVTSEDEYCKMLELLITNYMHPFLTDSSLDDTQHTSIFSGIENIFHSNIIFSKALQSRFQKWNNNESLIGDEILKFIPFLNTYEEYVQAQEERHTVLQYLQSQEKVHMQQITIYSYIHTLHKQQFIQLCSEIKDKSKGYSLKTLLLLPIQRCTAYELLLKEIASNTETTHIDYDNLMNAFKDISTVNIIHIHLYYNKQYKYIDKS